MMKALNQHTTQARGVSTRNRPPPNNPFRANPFNYILDDDLGSVESSKICHPRSSEAFKTAGQAALAELGSRGEQQCQCIAFLDPFPNQLPSLRSAPNLSHYCRVCNTQLNSCKQSNIHVEGKKHAKRLAYLKFCVETSAQNEKDMAAQPNNLPLNPSNMMRATSCLQQQQQQLTAVQTAPMMSSMPPPQQQQQQQPPPLQTAAYAQPPINMIPQYMSYGAPVSTASTTYFYPTCYQTYAQPQPPQQAMQPMQPIQPSASYQVPMYQEYVSPPPVPNIPPPTLTSMVPPPPPPPQLQPMTHYMPPNQAQQKISDIIYPIYPAASQPPDMLNPLLSMQYYESPRQVISSGYGSSSTTSTASPPSTTCNKGNNTTCSNSMSSCSNSKNNADSRKRFFCDLCQMAFQSETVLENHVNGSRHVRRLKSQQAFRQLKEGGGQQQQQQQQQQQHETSSHSCQVCQVKVNSTQQLQAHLEGHKHRARCFRRGLDQDTTTVLTSTPTSSTPSSSAPSECSSSIPNFPSTNQSGNNVKTIAQSSTVRCLNTNTNNSSSNKNKSNDKQASLLGRPRPLQANGMPGAGLMGASPHLASSAIISPATFIRRNGGGNGTGLLPLPLPGKMAGLLVAGTPVNFARVNRSNPASKSKGRKPNRPVRSLPQDNHDSTTESDEPASADGCIQMDIKDANSAITTDSGNVTSDSPSSLSSSPSSSTSASCSASTSGGEHSKLEINNDSSSDEAKECEGDCTKSRKDLKTTSQMATSQTSLGKVTFSCDKCDIRMNSAAQLAQHLKSPKHHMKAAGDGKVITESPLLNLFLNTLQSTPKTLFSSDKEGEESSSNTEVER